MAAPILSRQGYKQHAPIGRIRNDGDIRKRVNIQRILQRSLKRQTQRQIGICQERGGKVSTARIFCARKSATVTVWLAVLVLTSVLVR